jgi:LEA14-like dessication related protein
MHHRDNSNFGYGNRTWKHGVLALMLAWLVTGCASVGKGLIPVAPTLEVTGSQLTGISGQAVEVTLTILVKNPNGFELNNMGIALAVEANQTPLFSLDDRHLLQAIPANGQTHIAVPLTFPLSSIMQLVPNLLQNNQLEYSVSGHLFVPVPVLGQVKVPIKTQGALPIPKVPKFKIETIAIESLSLSHLALSVELVVENPNTFGLQSLSGEYEMVVNQASAGKVSVTTGRIPAGQSGRVGLTLSVSPLLIGMSVIQAQQWEMAVKGQSEWLPDLPGATPFIDTMNMVLEWPPRGITP